MATQLKRLDNGNIQLLLSIPWAQIQAQYEKEIVEAVENTELPGFRKGKAPRETVEKQLDKNQLYSHSIQHLLPDTYAAAVEEHKLKPILYPKIELTSGKEGEDWQFTLTTCEAPVVDLPADYQAQVKTVKSDSPDQKLGQILNHLREQTKIQIPDILVEEEANHRLTSLVENLTQLGLTTQSYLSSKKLDSDTLKAREAQASRIDLESEFILEAVRKDQSLPDRKQTLDFLISLN